MVQIPLFCICVWPTKIRILDEMMDRQKFIRMIDLSDLMYLHNAAYTTASVIKAKQERPQPIIRVTEGVPEYSMIISLGC